MSKGNVVEGDTKPIPGKDQAMYQPIVCDKCGKEFKNARGLAGHMAGVHGVKWGMNATLEGMRQELDGVKEALVVLARAVSQGGAIEKRYVELAQRKATQRRNLCEPSLDREIAMLEQVLGPGQGQVEKPREFTWDEGPPV
jgi:hypothetical protein